MKARCPWEAGDLSIGREGEVMRGREGGARPAGQTARIAPVDDLRRRQPQSVPSRGTDVRDGVCGARGGTQHEGEEERQADCDMLGDPLVHVPFMSLFLSFSVFFFLRYTNHYN
jgi:hypothetical protein